VIVTSVVKDLVVGTEGIKVMIKSIWSLLATCVLAALIGASGAGAAEIRLLSANAVKEIVLERVSAFERSSGHKVSIVWGGTEGLAGRVRSGEALDVIIVAAPNIDALIRERRLVEGSRTDFARSGVGVAVRSGLPRPDVSTAEAVRKAVLDARSITYSTGPSGFYVAELLGKLGIADQVRDRVRQPPSGVQVGELIARGEADLGFQQVSELLHVKGIDYLGPLPPDIQNLTTYAAGLHAASAAPDASIALMRFLAAPESEPIIRKVGMEPAPR